MVKAGEKKGKYRQWKQGRITWEEYRDAVWTCRDGIRKAKAQMELNSARNVENNKREIYRHTGQKRQAKESVPPLLNEREKLATVVMEEAEVLGVFFASVITGSQDSHIPEPKTLGRSCVSKLPPL